MELMARMEPTEKTVRTVHHKADGIDGKDGISISGAEINAAKELVLTFSDGTDKNLGVVVGTDGADGKDGINGTNGADGKDGRGIKKTEVNAIGELVITYTDDTTDNLGVIISDNGGAGTGAIAPRIQINASTNEWEISTDGGETFVSTGVKATGADGKDGADGADGKDGANGISVTGANINGEKELVLTFSDGTEKNLGVVVGADGKDGVDGQMEPTEKMVSMVQTAPMEKTVKRVKTEPMARMVLESAEPLSNPITT